MSEENKTTPLPEFKEVDQRVWKDSDILQHVQNMVRALLEESRHNDFKTEVSYNDLRLIAESVSIAIKRTEQGNMIVKTMDDRFEGIKKLLININTLATLKVTNEAD